MPLERLDGLYHNWRDDIPDQIIQADKPGPINYKVRRNWFHQVFNVLERALQLGEIPPDKVDDVKSFFARFGSPEFRNQERTTAADIEEANRLIEELRGIAHSDNNPTIVSHEEEA